MDGNSEALEVESEKSPASLVTRRRDGPAVGDSGRGICSGDNAGRVSAVLAPALFMDNAIAPSAVERPLVVLIDLIDFGVSSTSRSSLIATFESDVGSRNLILGVVALALRLSGVIGGSRAGVLMGVLRGEGVGEGDRLRLRVFLAGVGTPSRAGAGEDSIELGPAILILDSFPLPLPIPVFETFNKLPFLFLKSFSFFFSLPLSLTLSFSTVGDSSTSFFDSSDMSSC